MSVIIGRALPDVRDGLKPVHRRVLFAMREMGLVPNRALPQVRAHRRRRHRQVPSARRARCTTRSSGWRRTSTCAIRWSTARATSAPWTAIRRRLSVHRSPARSRSPSRDDGGPRQGDGRLRPELRRDDRRADRPSGAVPEPARERLVRHRRRHGDEHPAAQPREVIDGVIRVIEANTAAEDSDEAVGAASSDARAQSRAAAERDPGPDFPTGGFIVGRAGIRAAYLEGRGSHDDPREGGIRARSPKGDKVSIVVTEIPYQVNKARLIEKIAELVREKVIEGISDLRDESDRDGMRMVIELKRGEVPEVVLNNLFKHTAMQTTFGIIMLAIVGGRPLVLPLRGPRRLLHRVPPRRRASADRVRAPQSRGARAHSRRAEDCARSPRRGHQADSRVEESRRGPRRLDARVRPVADPVAGDPRHAAPAPHRPRAAEDHRRADRAAQDDRAAEGDSGERAPAHGDRRPRTAHHSGEVSATAVAPRSWTTPANCGSRI